MALAVIATITAVDPRPITLNFHGWRGWLGGIQARGDRAVRIGQRGSIRQITGYESPNYEINVWTAFASEPAMKIACDDLEALLEQTVAVSAPFNVVYPNVTVNGCRVTFAKRCKGPPVVGSTPATHRMEATLQLEVQPEAEEDD